MPPRKKARKSAPPKQLADPLEHISQTRESAAERFKSRKKKNQPEPNYDVEQNVREIRAILAMNREIFDRCIGSMVVLGGAPEDWWKQDYPYISFNRVSFDSVRTLHADAAEAGAEAAVTKFVTYKTHSELSIDMGALMGAPVELEEIIVMKHMSRPHPMFIDCNLVFEKALLLHEDVLEPVLVKIKDWLMSIQVCLGKIDTWVMEPQTIIAFLEEAFDQAVKLDCADGDLSYHTCACPKGFHHQYNNCEECGLDYSKHRDRQRCPNQSWSSSIRYFTCNENPYQVLRECNNVSGKHEVEFDMTKDNERKKLVKFLEFLAMD